jgi:tetratricopeptide (TPR) repeat protein
MRTRGRYKAEKAAYDLRTSILKNVLNEHEKTGNNEKFIADLKDVLSSWPQDDNHNCGFIYSQIGRAYKACGNYEEAIDNFTRSLAFVSDDEVSQRALVYRNRGESYDELERNTEAIKDFYQSSKLYFSLRQHASVINIFTKIIELLPPDDTLNLANAYDHRALSCKLLGDTHQAVVDSGRAGDLHRKSGKLNKAGLSYTRIIEWFPEGDVKHKYVAYVFRAGIKTEVGEFDKAKSDIAKAESLASEVSDSSARTLMEQEINKISSYIANKTAVHKNTDEKAEATPAQINKKRKERDNDSAEEEEKRLTKKARWVDEKGKGKEKGR